MVAVRPSVAAFKFFELWFFTGFFTTFLNGVMMGQLAMQPHYYKFWRELIKPKGFEVEKETLTARYGKFHVRPLERGFGVTLGNSLRRVLLSSMMGSAVSAVKFEGVLHEFSTIPD